MPTDSSKVWLFLLHIRHARFFLLVPLGFTLFAATEGSAENGGVLAQARVAPLFTKARQAEQRGDFAEAVRLYAEVIKIDPGIAEVWTNQGLCFYELNRHREATNSFAKAAELKPRLLVPRLFLGIEYLKLDQPQKAVSALQAALSIDPNHLQATYELANANVRLERFEQAVDLYRKLLGKNPQMEEAGYRLGIAYLNWSRWAARQLVDSVDASVYGKILYAELQAVAELRREAEANFLAAIARQPDLADARLAFALFYLDSQTPEQLDAARKQLTKAKDLRPGDLQVDMALVRLDLLQENFMGAVHRLKNPLRIDLPFARRHLVGLTMGLSPERLKTVIKSLEALEAETQADADALAKTSAEALLYSANLQLGTKAEAEHALRNLENLSRVQQLAPLEGSYSRRLQKLQQQQRSRRLSTVESLDLAVSAWNLGECDGALAAVLSVLQGEPNRRALFWLYRTCRSLAGQTFETTIAKNPESYRAHLMLGDLAKQSHDTAKAASEYEKAASIGIADPEIQLVLVQFLASNSRISEALEKAKSSVARFPTHAALNLESGKLLLKTGNAQQAIVHFQHALDTDSSLVEARAELADAYAASGDLWKAIKEMAQALPSDKDGSFHYRMGRWYQTVGQTSEASAAFAVASRLKESRRETERSKLIPLAP